MAKDNVVLKWLGGGFVAGVPARDLLASDFDGDGKCGGCTAAELAATGAYSVVSEGVKAAPQAHEGEAK